MVALIPLHVVQLTAALLWPVLLYGLWSLLLRWRRANKFDMDLIPGPWKSGHAVFGNLLQLIRPDFHRLMLEWANQYGGILRVRALWYDGLIVSDPTVVATICGRGDGALDKSSLMYTPINQMCSPRGHPNLLTSSADPAWRLVRKAVAAAFSVNNIRKKFPVVRGCSQQLVDQIVGLSNKAAEAGQPPVVLDLDQAALRVTLDVIGLAAFDHDFGCLRQACLTQPAPSAHLLRVLPRCFTEVMLRIVNPVRALVPSWFHNGIKGDTSFVMFQQEMSILLNKCLTRSEPPPDSDMSIGAQLWRVYHNQDPPPPTLQLNQGRTTELVPTPTRLQMLGVRLRQMWSTMTGSPVPAGRPAAGQPLLSAERILSEIGILFIEGFETTGHTTSWTLFNIATVPGVQERIADELAGLGLLLKPGANPGELPHLEMEHQHRLTYLTACVKEAMRMLPVVSAMVRTTGSEPSRVGPYLVPAHTPVGIPLFVIQNSDANWEQPGDYRPDRWLNVPVESYVMGSMPPLPSSPAGLSSVDEDEPDSSSSKVPSSRGSSGGDLASPTSSSEPASSEAWLQVHRASADIGPRIKSHPLLTADHADEPDDDAPAAHTADTAVSKVVASKEGGMATVAAAPRSLAPACADAGMVQPPPVLEPLGTITKGRKSSDGSSPPRQAADAKHSGGGVRFMPFSEGPRNCVGQTLAKMEVITLLAQLLGTFRVELAPEMGGRAGVRSRESTHLTLQTMGTNGLKFVMHPRWL